MYAVVQMRFVDASNIAVGAVLQQLDLKKLKLPIALLHPVDQQKLHRKICKSELFLQRLPNKVLALTSASTTWPRWQTGLGLGRCPRPL